MIFVYLSNCFDYLFTKNENVQLNVKCTSSWQTIITSTNFYVCIGMYIHI